MGCSIGTHGHARRGSTRPLVISVHMKDSFYKHYLLLLLMVILAYNYVDRLAVAIALQDIGHGLQLSDTQLGLLSGIAFAAFYSTMGIPIARWADRGNRVTIIALTTGLWSLMVALTGATRTFAQLLLVRAGVGVGEAGCVPTANSLIPDYFSRAERPRAMGVYMMGHSLSLVMGYFIAGWLNQFFGWRVMFVMLGVPGIGLALLAKATLREPRSIGSTRRITATVSADRRTGGPRHELPDEAPAAYPSVKRVVVTLYQNATFRHLLISFAVAYFFGNGLLLWMPTFFIRSYGLTTGQVGTEFAVMYGLAGALGTYCGGLIATNRLADDEQKQFRAMAVALSLCALCWMAMFLTHNAALDFGLMGIGAFLGSTISGPLFAGIQTLVPPRMRALAVALLYLCGNLIGLGLGPLATGALSDALRGYVGQESLRYALLILCPGYIWAGIHLWLAGNTMNPHVSGDSPLASLVPTGAGVVEKRGHSLGL